MFIPEDLKVRSHDLVIFIFDKMVYFEICICIIATVYTAIYGLDVCFNIYQNREEKEDEEMPEYIKRLYA